TRRSSDLNKDLIGIYVNTKWSIIRSIYGSVGQVFSTGIENLYFSVVIIIVSLCEEVCNIYEALFINGNVKRTVKISSRNKSSFYKVPVSISFIYSVSKTQGIDIALRVTGNSYCKVLSIHPGDSYRW